MQNKIIVGYKSYIKTLGYSKTSVYNLPKIVENFLCHVEQSETTKEIKNITEKDIRKYIEYIETRPNKNRKSGSLSVSYIKQHIYSIKLFFSYLEQIEMLQENPSTGIVYDKKVVNKQRAILTQEEIIILFKSAETLTETAVLHLAYSAGLRKSEIENLEVRDIDFRENRIYIRAGKNKKRRVIPITEKVKNELKNYYLEERIKTKSSYFLVNRLGNKMQNSSLYTILKPILKKSEIIHQKSEISLHSLRHSIATHLLENGMRVEVVRDFLGHNQLKTTQIYTRVNQINLKET